MSTNVSLPHRRLFQAVACCLLLTIFSYALSPSLAGKAGRGRQRFFSINPEPYPFSLIRYLVRPRRRLKDKGASQGIEPRLYLLPVETKVNQPEKETL